jgi:putative phosphoribosyl transferase
VNAVEHTLEIPATGASLEADIVAPEGAPGLVVFAHGSGSSRHSPRNRYVARELQRAGLGTVLVDLLTAEEERVDVRTSQHRFDIGLLASRLTGLIAWLEGYEPASGRGIGLFGASTGAAAALVAAATRPTSVQAVVSRGGRPDLAGDHLTRVPQPTLLIVGERDPVVIELNRAAMQNLRGETRLEIVPRASHLFEEPGTLEQVARLARDWFARHLRPVPAPGQSRFP